MDEVAHTSLSVHFLNKPTILRVNKNVCHWLLTAEAFCLMQDTVNVISLIDGSVCSYNSTVMSIPPPCPTLCLILFLSFRHLLFRLFTKLDAVRMAVKSNRKTKLNEDSSLGCRLITSPRAPVLFVTVHVSVCNLSSWFWVHAYLVLWYIRWPTRLRVCVCAAPTCGLWARPLHGPGLPTDLAPGRQQPRRLRAGLGGFPRLRAEPRPRPGQVR